MNINWPENISVRQREVALMLYDGMDKQQIAQYLGVLVGTINQHIRVLYMRMDFKTDADLIRWILDKKQLPVGMN